MNHLERVRISEDRFYPKKQKQERIEDNKRNPWQSVEEIERIPENAGVG